MFNRTIVCDNLVMGCKYEVRFVSGITNANMPEEPRETRFPSYYMGCMRYRNYTEAPRCVCCHRYCSDGAHAFLCPINGYTYNICPKCLSIAVSCVHMNYHCNEIMTEYWKYESVESRKNFIKEYAGAFVDVLRWMEIEPELAEEIEQKIVNGPDREIPPTED